MPAPQLNRDEVIDRLAAVFRQHGYEGASLKRLSAATGLGRSSLYHHFPRGKEDMAVAVLDRANAWIGEHVAGALKGAGPPPARLELAGRKLLEFYDHGRASCLLDLFATGEARVLFGGTVRQALLTMAHAFRDLAVDAGVAPDEAARRGEDAVIALQGALIVARGLGSPDPFERTIRELPERLFG